MIGKISGRIELRGTDHVLVDTGGVGYLVYCSERTLAALPGDGEMVALFTELVVREDLMQLFGFLTLAEKEWHRLLTSVQGVGAKAAMAILGTLGADGVSRALALGDVSAIRAAPGVGPKLAQRLMLELQAKAHTVMSMGESGGQRAVVSGMPETAAATPQPQPLAETALSTSSTAGAQADALSALVNLGYGHGDAAGAVAEAAGRAEAADAGELIRLALKRLAPKG